MERRQTYCFECKEFQALRIFQFPREFLKSYLKLYSISWAQWVAQSLVTNSWLSFIGRWAPPWSWFRRALPAIESAHSCPISIFWCRPSLWYDARSHRFDWPSDRAAEHLANSCRSLHRWPVSCCWTDSAWRCYRTGWSWAPFCRKCCWSWWPSHSSFLDARVHLQVIAVYSWLANWGLHPAWSYRKSFSIFSYLSPEPFAPILVLFPPQGRRHPSQCVCCSSAPLALDRHQYFEGCLQAPSSHPMAQILERPSYPTSTYCCDSFGFTYDFVVFKIITFLWLLPLF